MPQALDRAMARSYIAVLLLLVAGLGVQQTLRARRLAGSRPEQMDGAKPEQAAGAKPPEKS